MMLRGRRPILILLVAALLLTPARPAHAFTSAVLIAAVTYIGNELLGLFTGDGKLKGMLLVLETELPILLTTVEMKTHENIAKAGAFAHQERLKREAYARSIRDYPADVLQANCQAATPLLDSNITQAKAQAVSRPLVANELRRIGSSGGILGTQTSLFGTRPQPNDPVMQVKIERQLHNCRYGTENDLEDIKKNGCKDRNGNPITTLEQVKNSPYKGADTNADSLLGTDAFYEDHAYLAAGDYCYTMTGNRPLSYAEGRALSQDLNNIRNFLGTLSDKSARDLAAASCSVMITNRMPIDGKFANADEALGKLRESGAGATTGVASAEQAISDRAKTYLKEGLGYAELTQAEARRQEEAHIRDPKANPMPAPYVLKDQLVSQEQLDIATYKARWSAGKFVNRGTGKPALQYDLILWAKVANLQLQWRQYQELERQALTDAVELARLVRSAPAYGDPPPSGSRQ